MNFEKRELLLSLLYKGRHEIFFSEDSDWRTENLKELDETIEAVKEWTKDTLNEIPKSWVKNEEYAHVMTAEEWMAAGCRGMCFIPSDGTGYWGTEKEHSMYHSDVFGHKPIWATHVAWFNK